MGRYYIYDRLGMQTRQMSQAAFTTLSIVCLPFYSNKIDHSLYQKMSANLTYTIINKETTECLLNLVDKKIAAQPSKYAPPVEGHRWRKLSESSRFTRRLSYNSDYYYRCSKKHATFFTLTRKCLKNQHSPPPLNHIHTKTNGWKCCLWCIFLNAHFFQSV